MATDHAALFTHLILSYFFNGTRGHHTLWPYATLPILFSEMLYNQYYFLNIRMIIFIMYYASHMV